MLQARGDTSISSVDTTLSKMDLFFFLMKADCRGSISDSILVLKSHGKDFREYFENSMQKIDGFIVKAFSFLRIAANICINEA